MKLTKIHLILLFAGIFLASCGNDGEVSSIKVCDNQGRCIPSRTAKLSGQDYGQGWPFDQSEVVLVCPSIDGVRVFILGEQPYAANGFTQTFAKKWGITISVGRQSPRDVKVYEGAVGSILLHIEKICA